MAVLANRAKMTTSTTGTGTITLGSASTGFQTFESAGITNGLNVQYVIEDGANFEIGTGTYTSSGTTLTRGAVTESNNSDNAINLSGSAVVFIAAIKIQFDEKLNLAGGALTGALTTNSTIDGRDVAADGVLATNALPKGGGAMTGAITTNSTFDGRDVAADGVLATNALPKGGGTLTGELVLGGDLDAKTFKLESTTDHVRIEALASGKEIQLISANGQLLNNGWKLNQPYTNVLEIRANNSDNGQMWLSDSDGTVCGVFRWDDDSYGAFQIRAGNGEEWQRMNKDAGVEINYNAVKKFETTSAGVTIAGNIVVSGTVDGVDLQTLNTAVTANTAKTGITSSQASAITANTSKTGITSSQASAITANTSKTTNATHSGEVTGSGALTIAGNVVDEANLKVSNNPVNGYMLTAQSGNSGGLTWAAAGGGMHEFINEVTLSSAASTLSFTAMDSSKYKSYLLFVYNLTTSTANQAIRMRTSANGSSFDSGSSDYARRFLYNNGSEATFNGNYGTLAESSSGTQYWSMAGGLKALIHIIDPHNTSTQTSVMFQSMDYWGGNRLPDYSSGCMIRKSQAAVQGLAIYAGSGNVGTGIMTAYGITNS